MDTLSPESLNWALTHIERFGDTDIFPQAFEFEAIRANWREVGPALSESDLEEYAVSATQRVLVPKPGHGFRVAMQLDPFDCLVYTAMAYECADAIERYRVPQDQTVVCSYRISITPDGSFFANQDGWNSYHARSSQLAENEAYTHVVLADIADFYNQASHHRIANALESAAVTPLRARTMEAFLSALTAKQSRGLPVGPSASIVLAEACLDDVDKHLLSGKRAHVRYVDDFRIFCKSRKAAVNVLHDLTNYLYTAHRFSLQGGKTKIVPIDEFKGTDLFDPEEIEKVNKRQHLQALIERLIEEIGYEVGEGLSLADDDQLESMAGATNLQRAVLANIKELFEWCVAEHPLRLGLARHLLRRAKFLRARSPQATVLQHLEVLAPVFRDVALYLEATVSEQQANAVGSALSTFLRMSDVGQLPYVRVWALHLFARRPALISFDEALALAEASQRQLGLRPAALLAKSYGQVDWVRAQKENWRNHGPWDRRAILWCGSVLPTNERGKWLEMAKESDDLLDRSVAILAHQQS